MWRAGVLELGLWMSPVAIAPGATSTNKLSTEEQTALVLKGKCPQEGDCITASE